MPQCSNSSNNILAQQMFLGASISSFSCNNGWGGSTSSLNIELVNDFGSAGMCYATNTDIPDRNVIVVSGSGFDQDDHFYTCEGDNCYVDEKGNAYDENAGSKQRIIPGKVYHFLGADGLKARYWRKHDPGFFGDATLIDTEGVYNPSIRNNPFKYNIIGVPAYFRYGYFTFGGIIQSWEKTLNTGPGTYTVNLVSADDLLSRCYMILDNYIGSIFSKFTSSTVNIPGFSAVQPGVPTNYTGNMATFLGNLKEGNIPNVFNVYGFLENYGFGVSEKNDQGIPISFIIKSLSVLTSSNNKDLSNQAAFSPFGRIIAPIPLTDNGNPIPIDQTFNNYGFGICDIVTSNDNINRCEFILDLSELPVPPKDVRLDTSNTHISVLDFIRQVCDKTGRDFYTTIIRKNSLNVIKIKTINRTQPVQSNSVSSIIQSLTNSNIPTTAASVGQEHNTATPKVLYIGAKQQRLYQTKNYLLGYLQSSYVYNPISGDFIKYKDIGSCKIPSAYSTRNVTLSEKIFQDNPDISNIFTQEQKFTESDPDLSDTLFFDNDVSDNPTEPRVGNYDVTIKYDDNSLSSDSNIRYIPLNKNSISPFFGYTFDQSIDIDMSDGNTYRFIRPVYYDIWTGQLAVNMSISELPVLSIGRMPPVGTYQQSAGLPSSTGSGVVGAENGQGIASGSNQLDPPSQDQVRIEDDAISTTPSRTVTRPVIDFIITESEMRAAMKGWENYLAYCTAKLSFTKPDLFLMLVYTYTRMGKLIGPTNPVVDINIGNGVLGSSSQPVSNLNVSGEAKQPSGNDPPKSTYKQLGINFNLMLNHEFIKDLQIISNFIAQIGDEYYGKKYLVRLPTVRSYRDRQNPDIQIPAGSNNISVYQGSGKIYFDYEPVDGAWEEHGNYIDGEIEVGSANYYKLIDNNNLIKPLLGYNASYNKDFATTAWCNVSLEDKKKAILASMLPTTPLGEAIALRNRIGRALGECGTKLVPSLNFSNLSDYLLTDVSGTVKDAFDEDVPDAIRQKLYLPCSLTNQMAFLDPINLINPVAIMDAGQGIDLYSSSYSYTEDPNLTVISNAASEDFAYISKNEQEVRRFLNKIPNSNINIDKLKEILLNSIIPINSQGYLVSEGDTSNQQRKHIMISPKKAHPIYAGVPLKSNVNCYGPWTNYPSLADQTVLFPGINDTNNLLEHMISDVKIEQKDDLNPWTYGGMAFLDKVVVYDIINNLTYQTRLEQGSLSVASLPIFGLAGNLSIQQTDSDFHTLNNTNTFLGYEYSTIDAPSYNGLVISSLNISVSSNTLSTSYTFRTYSPKLGLFSKENSDRVKNFTNSISVVNRKIAQTTKNLENSVRKQLSSIIESSKTNRKSTSLSEYESKIYAASPTQLLIGKASHYIPNQTGVINNTGISTSWAGMFVPDEALSELSKQYSSKAVMSMDGLFSPVSLYPTEDNSTFAISSRAITSNLASRSITCPRCNNTGKITGSKKSINIAGQPTDIEYPCPLCSKSKVFGEKPSGSVDTNNSSPIINLITLNPLCLSSGEFRNFNSQSGDPSRYNIRVVGRSDIMPTGTDHSLDSFLNINSPEITDLNFGEEDKAYQQIYSSGSNTIKILNNHRFFAHRGPLMLHGWGYDQDGYPIPNEADEVKEVDGEGRPKRFFLTTSGTNDLTLDGGFLPTSTQKLGDIIGKGWKKENGQWTRKPSKKFYMNWSERPDLWPIGPVDLRWDYENKIWTGGGGGCNNADPPYIIASGTNNSILSEFISEASTPKKKCSYKMVYGILEQDLVKIDNYMETSPTRAFLDDLEYGLKPLPENIRRLIYIVDRTGYSAPRGAKMLLRYNTDTGFYEPVSKQQYIVFGTINSNNSATVEFNYMPGFRAGDATYRGIINYANPLNLQQTSNATGSTRRGAFMYDNSRWNLIAIG
jgi:hypothetical protein